MTLTSYAAKVIKVTKTWHTLDESTAARPVKNPERVKKLKQEWLAVSEKNLLAEIRRASGATQVLIADLLDLDQSRVSRIESADLSSMQLATLIDYVRAIDGKLTITITAGGHHYSISDDVVALPRKLKPKKAAKRPPAKKATRKPTAKRRAS